MYAFICAQVRSQKFPSRCASTAFSHRSWFFCMRRSKHTIASSAVDAISTRPMIPYGLTTSVIGVETTGQAAARNSGVLVGLMKRVDSFSAKGVNAGEILQRLAGGKVQQVLKQ